MDQGSIICRLCLVADVQMFNLFNDNLKNCYYNLTGVMNLGLFPYICYECLALLKRFGNFRNKCLTADQILKNVNIRDVRSIDRGAIGLKSTLIHINCITVTINSPDDRKPIIIPIDCGDEDEDIKPGKKTEIKEEPTKYNEVFVKKQDVDIEEELDENIDNYDDNSILKFDVDNPNVSATAAIVGDHPYSLKIKTEKEVQRKRRNTKNKRIKETRKKNYFKYLKGVSTITRLSPEDARKAIDERKKTKQYIKSTLKCHFCNRGFSLQATFDDHMKLHNPRRGNYECDYCRSRYCSRIRLGTHLEDYHTWKFECNTCSHVCFDTYTAKEHANTHSKKSCKCDVCSIIFKSYKSMLAHKRSKHVLNVVPCCLCGDTFSTSLGVKIHAQVLHAGETEEPNGPYCDLCDVRFATDVAWKRHFVLSDKHRDISNGCETCGEVFDTREKLREHAREYKHTVVKNNRSRWPYACLYCKDMIKDQDEYESHMSKEHPNVLSLAYTRHEGGKGKVICEICGMQFKSACFLKLHHHAKHSNERPFKCKLCAARFNNHSDRRKHQSTHLSDDQRSCQICGKVMKYADNVKVHMRRVHGVRPHKCTYAMCDKTFATPCQVKYHIRHFHCKIPYPKPNRSQAKKNIENEDS